MKRLLSLVALCVGVTATAEATPIVVATSDAVTLANAIAGAGITVSNATFTTNSTQDPAGTFTGGASSVGFDAGIVLTTGTTACVPGPNNQSSCTGNGTFSQLSFDFTSDTGQVSFSYVFGSEEYNEFVGSGFNDTFQLLLNGVNIALLPGAGGVVSINNVNCTTNSTFYRNNSAGGSVGCPNLGIDIQYDGLTTVLIASGTTNPGLNNFTFLISDVGDSILDSGVFIKSGSFTSGPPGASVPEPASILLLGTGLLGIVARRQRRRNT